MDGITVACGTGIKQVRQRHGQKWPDGARRFLGGMVRILSCYGPDSPRCCGQVSGQDRGLPDERGRERRDCKPIRNQWIARLHALFEWKTSMLPTGSHDTGKIRILD